MTRSAQTAWNAGIRPKPVPAVLLPVHVAAIECQLQAGIAPDVETALRMMATIRSLEQIVRRQAERVEDVTPGTMAAHVESRVPDLPQSVGRRA